MTPVLLPLLEVQWIVTSSGAGYMERLTSSRLFEIFARYPHGELFVGVRLVNMSLVLVMSDLEEQLRWYRSSPLQVFE